MMGPKFTPEIFPSMHINDISRQWCTKLYCLPKTGFELRPMRPFLNVGLIVLDLMVILAPLLALDLAMTVLSANNQRFAMCSIHRERWPEMLLYRAIFFDLADLQVVVQETLLGSRQQHKLRVSERVSFVQHS